MMEISTGRCWSATETQYHINYLELLATFPVLKTFANNLKGLIDPAKRCMDNISAGIYINQKGVHTQFNGTTVQPNPTDLRVVHSERDTGVMLQEEHLPGRHNILQLADLESWASS